MENTANLGWPFPLPRGPRQGRSVDLYAPTSPMPADVSASKGSPRASEPDFGVQSLSTSHARTGIGRASAVKATCHILAAVEHKPSRVDCHDRDSSGTCLRHILALGDQMSGVTVHVVAKSNQVRPVEEMLHYFPQAAG